MLPTFQFFGRTITMYGLLIAIGLVIGITIMVLRSTKYLIKQEDALFAAFFGCIGLFIGAKVLHLILSIPELFHYRKILVSNPSLLYQFFLGGYIFYGGLIGAIFAIYLYCKKFKVYFIGMLDLAAPSIPIIHGFGRIGCFFAGCCYGVPYDGPGHVIFENSLSAPNQVALLPTQLFESGINFIAGILLLLYASHIRKPGRIIGFYVIYYSLLRFGMEFFRGDIVRGFTFGISTSQWISLLLLPIGVWIAIGKRSKL